MSGTNDPGYTAPDLALVGDEHVRQYEASGGAIGHDWNGARCLVLSTTGRRTGETRKSALIYSQVDGEYVVVASKGGAPEHPTWYLNLEADPSAFIQVGAERLAVIARTAEDSERDRLWSVVTTAWPNYDVYTTRTTRRIPVVILNPQGAT